MWSSCKRELQVALSLHPSLCGLESNLILDFTSVLVASNQKEAELFILFSVRCIIIGFPHLVITIWGWPILPAPLYVVLLCLWNGKATMTCFVVCALPHAHGGANLCCCWGLPGPESADRWPLSAWEVGAEDLPRVVMSDTRCLFAISLGYSFSQTHWVVGFSSSHSSACQLQDECPHSGCRMSWTRCG